MNKAKRLILLIVLGLLLTIILTWPLLSNLTSYYPDYGDYPFNGAQLWYNQDSLKSGRIFNQSEYLKGYQFYPQPYSFAFANNAFIPSLIFTPIYFLSGQIPFSVNTYAMLTLVFSFLTAFYTIHYFVKNTWASFIGAFIFAFNPTTFIRFPQHLDVLGKFFLPLVFLYAYQFFEKPNFKRGFLFSLFFSLNALTVTYYQIFSLIMLPIVAIPFLWSNLFKKRWVYLLDLAKYGAIFLVFLPILVYFNFPYLEFSQKEGVVRSIDESAYFSARLNDYFAATPNNLIYGGWVKMMDNFRSPKDPNTGIFNYEEHTLFVGFLPVILFLIGFRIFFRQKINKVYFLLLLVLPFIFTFGPYIGGKESFLKLPFYFIYEWVPFFRGIRSPTRFEFVLLIPFALICAFGVKKLLEGKSKRMLIFIPALIVILLTLENITIKSFDEESKILSTIDQIGKDNLDFLQDKVTLHLPIFTLENDQFGKNSAYLNWLTQTGERIINGNTSYLPPDQLMFLDQLKDSFNEKLISKLIALGADYLIIHKDLLDSKQLESLSKEPFFQKGVAFSNSNILIIDLSAYNLSPSLCVLERDFDIKFGRVADDETSYALVLTNKGNCFLVSIYEDRYRQIDVTVDGVKRKAHLRMPILVESGQQVILSQINRDLKIK